VHCAAAAVAGSAQSPTTAGHATCLDAVATAEAPVVTRALDAAPMVFPFPKMHPVPPAPDLPHPAATMPVGPTVNKGSK